MENIAGKTNYKILKVSSSAFNNNHVIPGKYTCDGENVNPPLSIEQIPANAKSLAIVVDDPDAPAGTWVHWLMWNIPLTYHIKENEASGIQGMNDFSRQNYGGPCPPNGTHRYFFKIYVLDNLLRLPVTSRKEQLEKVMNGHIIAYGELIGLYSRRK
ncbi:MAG TPA: YbhB/YbcL family Raf kinase inhibitor-like protein [Puia sp.]|nr:YbhB/YbcL family Raf kinase inhibitor-like protein [Puia sp.]